MSIDFSEIQTLTNPASGSTFYVVATTPKLLVGLRAWVKHTQHHVATRTEVGVRIRVEPKKETSMQDFMDEVAHTFPDGRWSSFSTKHVSVSGVARIDLPPWEKEGILSVLTRHGVIQAFRGYIKACLPNVDWVVYEEDLDGFLDDFLTILITKDLNEYEKYKTTADQAHVVIKFDNGKGLCHNEGTTSEKISLEDVGLK